MAGVGRDNRPKTTKDSAPNDADKPTKVSKVEVKQKNKTHRYRPGTAALREIRGYKVSNDLSKKKELFRRLVKEILANFNPRYGIRETAVMALQEASECVVKNTFEIRNLLAIRGNRITIQPKDVQLARRIGGKL